MTQRLTVRGVIDTLPGHRLRLSLAEEPMTSLPVPVEHGGQAALGFFLFPWSGAPPGSPQLYPPIVRLILGRDGALLEAGATTPGQFGLSTPADVALGEHTIEPELDLSEFEARKASLESSLDRLLDAGTFWLDSSGAEPIPAPLRTAATEYDAVFRRIAHRPLLACYRAMNPRFFAWLERAVAPAAGTSSQGDPPR